MSAVAASEVTKLAMPGASEPPKPEGSRIRVVSDSAAKAAPAGGTPNAQDAAKIAELEAASLKLLGQVTWLLSLSPAHRHMFIADLEWRIRPAIVLRQCRLFVDKGKPVGFVTWAYVSEEIAGRLQAMPDRLKPEEWRSGKRLMIMDVVAPFGGGPEMAREIIKQHEAKAGTETETAAPKK